MLLALCPSLALGQGAMSSIPGADSVEVVAGPQYQAGGLHRFFYGSNYRDLWTKPIRVPVLDLQTYAGGLRPVKAGGGNQTKSLHLVTPDGVDYVFRGVYKADAIAPAYNGTVVETVVRDQTSTNDPGGPLVAARLLDAADVLHVTPVFAVMPDDTLLGKFRKEFAGQLGLLEESPGTPKHHAGFAGAAAIIDSDSLRSLLDSDPREQVDAPAFLAARLMDMLFNDWDRHPGQWKWARMQASPPTVWLPIPRDRDKTFISSGGVVIKLAGLARPTVYPFTGSYPSVRALTWNSLALDRRLLDGLAKPVWDSVAAALVSRLSDSVIDEAVRAVPPEYLAASPRLASTLKQRRDGLPGASDRFYRALAAAVDIHAPDAPDRTTVARKDDGTVEVQLQSGAGAPYFLRRFDPKETREIRLYLHGGDDTALVTGKVEQSITVRIIGGDGTNLLMDSSRVGGSTDPTHLYDNGTVSGISYGPDTLFDRRPWVRQGGRSVPPGPDAGSRLGPIAAFSIGDLGVILGLGLSRDRYGFRRRPYASQVGFEAEYATGVNGFRVGVDADHRLESSPVHFMGLARMSQLQLTNFYGFGNTTPGTPSEFYQVRQQQWLLQPAVAIGDDRRSELSLGPVVQYSVTDSTPSFVTDSQPYGSGDFGEAGLRVDFSHDGRDQTANPHHGYRLNLTGTFFPAIWNVNSAFSGITVAAATYLTIPIPLRPVLALRGSASEVFGAYPFQESAFVGGRSTVRTLVPQRYAGDASLSGTAELRLALARFAFVLPLDVGVFGFVDAGRVFVDGSSPGGWHTAAGGGVWVGVMSPATAITVTVASGAGQTVVLIGTGLSF
jgi:hypothetical protein